MLRVQCSLGSIENVLARAIIRECLAAFSKMLPWVVPIFELMKEAEMRSQSR